MAPKLLPILLDAGLLPAEVRLDLHPEPLADGRTRWHLNRRCHPTVTDPTRLTGPQALAHLASDGHTAHTCLEATNQYRSYVTFTGDDLDILDILATPTRQNADPVQVVAELRADAADLHAGTGHPGLVAVAQDAAAGYADRAASLTRGARYHRALTTQYLRDFTTLARGRAARMSDAFGRALDDTLTRPDSDRIRDLLSRAQSPLTDAQAHAARTLVTTHAAAHQVWVETHGSVLAVYGCATSFAPDRPYLLRVPTVVAGVLWHELRYLAPGDVPRQLVEDATTLAAVHGDTGRPVTDLVHALRATSA